MQDLDSLDKQILNILQQNNRKTAEEIGALLNLSTSAVQRRIQNLRYKKIIEADISIIAKQFTEFQLSFIVEVSLYLGSSIEIEKFKSLMNNCEYVSQCYFVAGLYDFILVVNTKDMKQYELFSHEYLSDNKSVKQYYTHVVLNRVKMQYGILF